MGTKLRNAPVFYTIAQVQYNPILNLDEFIPRIQSHMRNAGLPDYRQFPQPHLVISALQNVWPAPPMLYQPRYLFGDIEERSMIVVDANAASFETTAYDTFEAFLATLMRGLEILNDLLDLNFVERIGLRYLDAVQTQTETETLADFLVPEVLGLSSKTEGKLQHSISETVLSTTHGDLVTRVLIKDGALELPDEILGFTPVILERFSRLTGRHAVIESDAFLVRREPFNLDTIKMRLCSLHEEIDRTFKATVTEHALNSWA